MKAYIEEFALANDLDLPDKDATVVAVTATRLPCWKRGFGDA
jgi:hypothetical protein